MSGGDQKLEVIRKLLAKAEKAATPDEASAYNAKAAEMMARHGVSEAMLAATGVKQDALGERRIPLADPYSQEKAQLAGLIGRALGCRAVRHPGYGRGQIIAVTIFGYESDLQRTEVLFTSLLLQATRDVVHQRPPAWTGESTAAFRRTWLTGFATEIYRRLTAAERAATEQHDASAVTVAHRPRWCLPIDARWSRRRSRSGSPTFRRAAIVGSQEAATARASRLVVVLMSAVHA